MVTNANPILKEHWILKVCSYKSWFRNFLLIQIFFFNLPLWSHTLIFKDLQVVRGIVYKQDASYLYFKTENGNKDVKVRKDSVGKVIVQDITDDTILKKLIKKVKEQYPSYQPPPKNTSTPSTPPPSTPQEGTADLEIQNISVLLAEIEEDEKLNTIKLKRRDALFKSILFPGLGHLELERKGEAYLYAGTFLALTLATIQKSQNVNEERSKYDRAISNSLLGSFIYNPGFNEARGLNAYLISYQLDRGAYKGVENAIEDRNQLAVGLVAVYLAQIFHCYWIGKSSEVELEKRGVSFNFQATREAILGNQGFFTGAGITIHY